MIGRRRNNKAGVALAVRPRTCPNERTFCCKRVSSLLYRSVISLDRASSLPHGSSRVENVRVRGACHPLSAVPARRQPPIATRSRAADSSPSRPRSAFKALKTEAPPRPHAFQRGVVQSLHRRGRDDLYIVLVAIGALLGSVVSVRHFSGRSPSWRGRCGDEKLGRLGERRTSRRSCRRAGGGECLFQFEAI